MSHENLWAPWRMAYMRELERKAAAARPDARDIDTCFFTAYWQQPELDEQHHVIVRDDHGLIMLNRYPYSNGHLLVALGDPRPTLLAYEPPQRAAFWHLMEQGMQLIEQALAPQGINAGLNIGRAAGAGVPEHVHGHLVPRWSGDTNFITVVGQVRVVPDSLEAMAATYGRAANALGLVRVR